MLNVHFTLTTEIESFHEMRHLAHSYAEIPEVRDAILFQSIELAQANGQLSLAEMLLEELSASPQTVALVR